MGNFGLHVRIVIVLVFCFLNNYYKQINGEGVVKLGGQKCNLFAGRWVYDDSYPIYSSRDCPFMEKAFNCEGNGRKDNWYLKYRWQPHACNLPRFQGKDLMERLRGKRIMFVGDSLSLNQWQSLTCMLHKALPQAHYKLSRTKDISNFKFPAYNVSITLYRSSFLVDLVSDKTGRVLKLNSMTSKQKWRRRDILIFNTWHWWLHKDRQQPWDYIQEGNKKFKDMNRLIAFEKGLNTWARWVDSNIDPKKTRVFFQGISPDHSNAKAWGDQKATDCNGEKKPLLQSKYPGGPHPAEAVLKRVLKKMSTKVYLLSITNLSQLRKDGHPSIYGYGGSKGSDCSHWCLPGVPDTWNQLLYAALIQS